MNRNVILFSTLLLGAACAQDVGDIDRTQPNRLKKSLFEGEWFHQKTVFDVPYTAGFTFIGEQLDNIERVRWQIEEGFLIAYRSYDLVENTQGASQLADIQLKGAPVAAYAILSHFDVIRDYNSVTGEETNVLYENTTDRPWYERQYFRVDWSKNLVNNHSFIVDGLTSSPIAYYVQDRKDDDRLLLGTRVGEDWTDTQDWDEIAALDAADYIDIVDTIFVDPGTISTEDAYGTTYEEPACWYYYLDDCQPARIKVRSAFMKVDDTESYEALAYPDNKIARDAEGKAIKDSNGAPIRIPYLDKFGYFRVERFNYDRQREITESGRTYFATRWGIWKDAPGCIQDGSYANCTVRPIVYYLSPEFPLSLVPAARLAVAQWNDALKDVVNQLKYAGTRPKSEIEDVFILRSNSYVANESRGERIGDLRFSFIYYVKEPQQVGPLGYGPSGSDPLTGRIINASAFVYGAALESWATVGADVVQLINGQLSSTDLIEGEDVRELVTRLRGDYAANASQMNLQKARAFAGSKQVRDGRAQQRALGKRRMRLDRSKVRAKLDAIRDTTFETRLLNDDLVRSMHPPSRRLPTDNLVSTLSPAERRRLSPAGWATTGALRARERRRQIKLQKNNVMLSRNADDAVVALATRLAGNTDRDEIRAHILERVFASTLEHEIGHTLGLRHNFGGSYDALNYHQKYWEIRGSSPQPFAPFSQEELQGGVREYQYSSIMDYSGRFALDIQGIGLYDRAAIHFGYGQLVSVFQDGAGPTEPLTDTYDLDVALQEFRHYTSLPRIFGGDALNMYRRVLVPYDDVIKQRTNVTTTNLREVPFRFCSDEYDGSLYWCNTYDEGPDPYEIVRNANQAYEDYYFFNSFARDQFLNHDPYSHQYDVYARYMLPAQLQYQHWVFRGYDDSSDWDALRTTAAAYGIEDLPFDQAVDGGLSGATASRLAINFLGRIVQAPEPGAYFVDSDDGVFYNYSYSTTEQLCPPGMSLPDCSDLNVPLGPGKYAFSLYKGASGYYFYDRIHVIGSFYDKLAALETLTSPETTFLGVDSAANLTQFAISMYLMFPEQVTRLVGGAAVESYDRYAGRVDLMNQTYSPRDMFAADSALMGTAAVDPATSFTVELWAAWLGMAFLNANFDNSFNDLMRIWLEGNGDAQTPTVSDPTRIARFTHPRTGRTFMSVRHEDATRYSPGYDLVSRTQRQLDDPSLSAASKRYYVENAVQIIETIRGLNELYGKLYF